MKTETRNALLLLIVGVLLVVDHWSPLPFALGVGAVLALGAVAELIHGAYAARRQARERQRLEAMAKDAMDAGIRAIVGKVLGEQVKAGSAASAEAEAAWARGGVIANRKGH